MMPGSDAESSLIRPDWPAPANVMALVTTRCGGVSGTPFDTFNLAFHTGDSRDRVTANRDILQQLAGISGPICWVNQVHGVGIADAEDTSVPDADAIHVRGAGAAAVLTADCLPVLLADCHGREAMVVHAGWRGLAAGIVERAVHRMASPSQQLLAWLGPAIGPCHFEVGQDVRDAFLVSSMHGTPDAFRPGPRPGKWMADIYALARIRLYAAGVGAVYGGGLCTVCDQSRFFSYRRDGITGRMATLICLNAACDVREYA